MKHPGANNIHAKPTRKVGFVLKPHGYSGHLKIHIDNESDCPNDFLLILIHQKFVPFAIESYNEHAGIVKLKGLDSLDSASMLTSLPIVALDNPDTTATDPNLTGYSLVDTLTDTMYEVTAIIEMPGQDLIEFRAGYKDCLLPIHEDIIKEINHDTRTIYAVFPDGILDL